ncbi:hypothetical protein AncyloWKF20_16745 [Ancylobacter sp. WKF20]|uniref:hypothetical protein n=1 Tax=Ancylobacter sp. WKF20 TaxID=3039801 RepID=UPI0024345DDB|nr:hypothetical protein [Ancylobacter sp. WKF20]WGD29404.1 hypothetical protein AncyloWKF20_16745 [Ancylobacter sp. WKF20]
MVADAIKRDLKERGANSPILQLCLRLVDYVASLPSDQREMLTYRTFIKAAGKERVDQDLMAALTILSTSNIHAFDIFGLFIDENDDEFEISAEDLFQAQSSGEFAHPSSGRLVPDFEDRIVPFFVPSERFSAQ